MKADKVGTKKIVDAINETAKEPKHEVDKKFDRSWNELKDALNKIPKPSDVFASSWLWKDGQRISIHENNECESFKGGIQINAGTWKQSDSDKYTFTIMWNMQQVSDILKLSADHRRLEGHNSCGDYVTAEVDGRPNELPCLKLINLGPTGPRAPERKPDS
jgi:hypothetical protein